VISKRSVISPLLTDDGFEQERARLVDGGDVDGGDTGDPLLGVVVELDLRRGLTPSAVAAGFQASHRDLLGKEADARPAYLIAGGYFRCLLRRDEMSALVLLDAGTDRRPGTRSIFRIWPDYVMRPHIDRSRATVKADAAGRTYEASGSGIVWAVLDTGIDATHPHFSAGTLTDESVRGLHCDFTWLVRRDAAPPADCVATALVDENGHGTHVAGIIAGRHPADSVATIASLRPATNDQSVVASDWPQWGARKLVDGRVLDGMAPHARLVSLKVLDGQSEPSAPRTTSAAVIAALAHVREVNAYGRSLQIHGVNLSLGCEWHPQDYAAGQSPLCRELDLTVATGVVAVVSAGNTGAADDDDGGRTARGNAISITEPGHAQRVITVGATHRDSPHVFGVWWRSAKGPTLDGRRKPDLVAPGEAITSASTGWLHDQVPQEIWQAPQAAVPAPRKPSGGKRAATTAPPRTGKPATRAAHLVPVEATPHYAEESGTSMAAPHVSGVIAAFLSARHEFVGQPDVIKELFCATAVDLQRDVSFQGCGLVDLMAALTKV
jgi:subtilisin family serine protease